MASLGTVEGAAHLENRLQGVASPAHYYLALVTDAVTPTRITATLSELTEIAAGNGYTAGGYELDLNTTDFPTLTKSNANFWATLFAIDIVWTAAGGPIPISGDPARWAVLTDANATHGSRKVFLIIDLGGTRVVQDTFALTIQFPNGIGRVRVPLV